MAFDFETVKNDSAASLDRVASWLNLNLAKRGREWFGHCPLPSHTEKTPSFTIGGKKRTNSFYCFGCGASGDCFDLVSSLTGLTKYESLLWIAERAGIQPPDKTSRKTDRRRAPSVAIPATPSITPPESIQQTDKNLHDEVYRAVLDKLPFEGWARKNIESRGGNSDKFAERQYRSLPSDKNHRIEIATEIARQFKLGDERRVAGFFRISEQKWCFAGDRRGERRFNCYLDRDSIKLDLPGLLIPSLSLQNKIQFLKVRNPSFPFLKYQIDEKDYRNWIETDDSADNQKYEKLQKALKYFPPKYQVLTSNDRPGGCSIETSPHFSLFSDFSLDKFILTEGELKADLIASATNLPVMALPGVNLNHDKITRILNHDDNADISYLYGIEDLRPLKTLPELYRTNPFDYHIEELEKIIDKLSSPTIIFALDRDNSRAVVASLNKFILMQSRLKSGYKFLYLFWNENQAKGFDDLVSLDGLYSYADFDKIFASR